MFSLYNCVSAKSLSDSRCLRCCTAATIPRVAETISINDGPDIDPVRCSLYAEKSDWKTSAGEAGRQHGLKCGSLDGIHKLSSPTQLVKTSNMQFEQSDGRGGSPCGSPWTNLHNNHGFKVCLRERISKSFFNPGIDFFYRTDLPGISKPSVLFCAQISFKLCNACWHRQ